MLWLPLVSLVAMGQGEVAGVDRFLGRAAGQAATQNLDDPVTVDDVDVRGRRGAARVPAETELSGAEIDALGAWDIGEVLQRMRETLGVGETPMVIVNGRRVANSSVFSGFPPDALVRAEVLPPGAAALYGGAPGQRVVNLVLQRRFSSHDARVAASRPTQGGTSSLSGDLRRSAISGENTHQIGLRASRDTALRAEERDRDLPGDGPQAGAVTLRPRADAVSANATVTRSLGDWSSVINLNGQVREARSVVRLGADVVESRRQNESLGGSVGLSGIAVGWAVQANLSGAASRAREDGFADARYENQTMGLNGSAGRTLFDLSTGPVVVNLAADLTQTRAVTDRDDGRATTRSYTREARGSLAAPISKANAGSTTGGGIGDLLATVGGSVRATGAGDGDEVNGALLWTPRKGVTFNGLWAISTDSVSDAQRFEPLYRGAPTAVFDFKTGQAVEILPILGGNPNLRPPQSERWSLTGALGPFTAWGLSATLGYQRSEAIDGIGALPELTEDVEAAFPDRFDRDAGGRLISIDYRPLNLGSSLTEGLNTNINFNLPRPTGQAANEALILRVAISHSLRLRHTVALLPGQAELDRLRGDVGGVSRQDARVMIDARRGRWGVNASARWQEGYRTRRTSGRDDPRDLLRSPFAAVDLKLSFQMTPSPRSSSRGGEEGLSRRPGGGLQLALDIENLLDARPNVTLGDGSPAPGFGRDFQDPLGRVVRLTLQRRF